MSENFELCLRIKMILTTYNEKKNRKNQKEKYSQLLTLFHIHGLPGIVFILKDIRTKTFLFYVKL